MDWATVVIGFINTAVVPSVGIRADQRIAPISIMVTGKSVASVVMPETDHPLVNRFGRKNWSEGSW
jgi:hypothetical protein